MSSDKRPLETESTEDADEGEGWIGPMPSEAAKPKTKKRKGLLLFLYQTETVLGRVAFPIFIYFIALHKYYK